MKLERALAAQLLTAHPAAAATVLESLTGEAASSALADAPPQATAEVLLRMAPQQGGEALSRMEGSRAQEILEHLGTDSAAVLLRHLSLETRQRLMGGLSPESAGALQARLEFPPGTAGAVMDSRVLALPEDLTVADAIDRIRKSPDHVRYNLYVVDQGKRLVGVMNLRELFLADRKQTLGSIARGEVLSIPADADRSAILRHPAWQEIHSLPVVDRRGTYLGAIRYRAWRLLEDEARGPRARRDTTTADALSDLLSIGVEGAVEALTDLASRATLGQSDDGR